MGWRCDQAGEVWLGRVGWQRLQWWLMDLVNAALPLMERLSPAGEVPRYLPNGVVRLLQPTKLVAVQGTGFRRNRVGKGTLPGRPDGVEQVPETR